MAITPTTRGINFLGESELATGGRKRSITFCTFCWWFAWSRPLTDNSPTLKKDCKSHSPGLWWFIKLKMNIFSWTHFFPKSWRYCDICSWSFWNWYPGRLFHFQSNFIIGKAHCKWPQNGCCPRCCFSSCIHQWWFLPLPLSLQVGFQRYLCLWHAHFSNYYLWSTIKPFPPLMTVRQNCLYTYHAIFNAV